MGLTCIIPLRKNIVTINIACRGFLRHGPSPIYIVANRSCLRSCPVNLRNEYGKLISIGSSTRRRTSYVDSITLLLLLVMSWIHFTTSLHGRDRKAREAWRVSIIVMCKRLFELRLAVGFLARAVPKQMYCWLCWRCGGVGDRVGKGLLNY